MTPLAVPGLLLAGASKVPLKRYSFWCAMIILPRAIFFTITGYFFGVLTSSILNYYKMTEYVILALVIGVALIFWLSKKLSKKVYRSINKEISF